MTKSVSVKILGLKLDCIIIKLVLTLLKKLKMRRMEPVVCLSLYYKSSSDLLKTNQASRETQLIAKILWPVLLVPTFTSNNSILNFWTKFT